MEFREWDPRQDAQSDWIVSRVTLAKDGFYRLWVEGKNLSADGAGFFWNVCDVVDPRYDLSHAEIAVDALPFLGR